MEKSFEIVQCRIKERQPSLMDGLREIKDAIMGKPPNIKKQVGSVYVEVYDEVTDTRGEIYLNVEHEVARLKMVEPKKRRKIIEELSEE